VYYGTQSNKIDFSDTNEIFEITGQTAIASDMLTFFTRFDNGSGGGSPAATCSDGIQNQSETGTDCGGPCTACGGGGDKWLEAECASTKVGGYSTTQTAVSGYSGTGYILNVGDTTSAGSSVDKATYVLSGMTAGSYNIWFRVNVNATTNDDSWFYGLGTGTPANTMNNYSDTGWVWKKGGTNLSLAAGANTISVWNRENGLKMDKLYLTTSATTPSGTGNAGTNCP
jgi:hypothetical protein